MIKSKHLITCVCLLCFASLAFAQGEFPQVTLENGYNQPMHIWYAPVTDPDWVKPTVFLSRAGTYKIAVRSKSEYYMVGRDIGGHED